LTEAGGKLSADIFYFSHRHDFAHQSKHNAGMEGGIRRVYSLSFANTRKEFIQRKALTGSCKRLLFV